MSELRLPAVDQRKLDGRAVNGALMLGHSIAGIARALSIRGATAQLIADSRAKMSRKQRQALEALTGRSTAELAFDALLRQRGAKWRRENAAMIKATRDLFKDLRADSDSGAIRPRSESRNGRLRIAA